jgi:tetratricopeptide (TPR) repeat protein
MQLGRSGLPSERARRGCCAVPWLAFALGFLGAPGLSAQERTLSGAAAPTEALDSPRAASAESEAAGAELYKQAESHYVAGDVAGALALMQKAYAASERPELLFNLGQLHRELHHCREARESYERYLALAKNGTRHAEAARSRNELALECPVAAGAPPLASEPEPVKSYWTPVRIAGWSTIGGSVVLGATAGYFALHAHHLQNQLESDIQKGKSTGDGYVAAYHEVEDEGQHAAVVARGLAVTALGVAAIGVSLLVFSPEQHDAHVNTVSVRCTLDGANAVYTGSF